MYGGDEGCIFMKYKIKYSVTIKDKISITIIKNILYIKVF